MSSMLVNTPSRYPAAFFHFYYTKNFKNYKQKGKIYLLSYIATYQFLIYSSPVPDCDEVYLNVSLSDFPVIFHAISVISPTLMEIFLWSIE